MKKLSITFAFLFFLGGPLLVQSQLIKTSPLKVFRNEQTQFILKNAYKFQGSSFKLLLEKNNKTEVFVSRESKFPESKKEEGRPMPNENCNVLGVNLKTSYPDFTMFFPNQNITTKIYPGALYKFNEIKSSTLTPYQHNFKRNPLSLNTDIFTKNNRITNSVKLNAFDYSTVYNSWNSLLSSKIKGITGADIYTKLVIVESKEQLERELETINSVSVGVELNIPIPNLPVTVSPSLAVTTTNASQLKNSIANEKSYAILRVEQTFYNSNVTYLENPNGGIFPVFQDATSIPDDLMMVSSVSYGRVFYLIFKSSLNKEELYKAIQSKVEVDAAVGVAGTGLPIGGKVSTNISDEEKEKYSRIWESKEIEITVRQWGGKVIPLNAADKFDISKALDAVNEENKFSAENIGNPIRYTLQFAKDYANAFVNVDTKYATHNCGKEFSGKYDVEVVFKKINCDKAKGGSPDIYGKIDMLNISCTNCIRKPEASYNFWEISNEDNAIEFSTGDSRSFEKTKKFSNLTLNEITSLRFKLKASLRESDYGNDDKFESEAFDFSIYNKLHENTNNTILDNIIPLQKNEKIQIEKKIECFEDGNENASKMSVSFVIKITAK